MNNLTVEEYENRLDEHIKTFGSLWMEFHKFAANINNRKYKATVHFVEKYFHTEYNIYLFL